jgi:dTDP-4-amino-4,6-dideoxygalactose transaminase
LQAAILRVKLRHLNRWADARAEKAAVYDKLLAGCPQIQTPKRIPGTTHVFHQYTVRVPNRDAVQKRLAEAGVPTMVYYPMSICLQPVYRHLGYQPGDMPETDRAITEVLSLPIYPELSEMEQSYIANELIDAVTAEISAI